MKCKDRYGRDRETYPPLTSETLAAWELHRQADKKAFEAMKAWHADPTDAKEWDAQNKIKNAGYTWRNLQSIIDRPRVRRTAYNRREGLTEDGERVFYVL